MLAKRFLILLLVIGLSVLAVGCSDDDDDDDPAVDEFTVMTDAGDDYFTTYKTTGGSGVNVSIDQVFDWLTNSDPADDPFIVDWRTAELFAAGHIEGNDPSLTVNWNIADLDDHFDDLPTDRLIVNVCWTGHLASYATATMNLLAKDPDYAGIEAANLLFAMCSVTSDPNFIPQTTGWVDQIAQDEWVNALVTTTNDLTTTYDFPSLDTGYSNIADIIKARHDAAYGGGWAISADDVFGAPDDYFVINYWPTARYEDPGHIPGAYCIQPAPNNELTASGKLEYLPTDKTIVVYCYTGQTSTQVTAYLRLLGYDAKSLRFGMNGFAYQEMVDRGWAHYTEPTNDYSAIIKSTGTIASN